MELQRSWGFCTVDMFASLTSKKCPLFFSRWCSYGAVAADAFSVEAQPWWKFGFSWWVPPPTLIAKTIVWARKYRSKRILGFPVWPSNIFFSCLRLDEGWIPEIKRLVIYPAGSPVLKGSSPSYIFGSSTLNFDFAFAHLRF